MANYSTLKAAVADVVKTNGTQEITGANLQSVLLSIINSVGGGGYIFKGVATPSTSAGTPDENVFYVGGAGTYANFGTSITVPVGSICVFKYNGSWTKEQIAIASGIDVLQNDVDNLKYEQHSGIMIHKVLHIVAGTGLSVYESPLNIKAGHTLKLKLNPTNYISGNMNIYLYYGEGDTDRILVQVTPNGAETIKVLEQDIIKIQYNNSASRNVGTGDVSVDIYEPIYAIKSDVDEAIEGINDEITDISTEQEEIQQTIYGVNAAKVETGHNGGGSWEYVNNPKYNHLVFPVTAGQIVHIVGITGGQVDYGVLKTYTTPTQESEVIDYSSIISGRQRLSGTNLEATFTVPSDAHYIVASNNYNATNGNLRPTVLTLDGADMLTGVAGLVDLDKQGVLVYTKNEAANASSEEAHPSFMFYSPNNDDTYFGFHVELCIHNASDFYQYMWRLTDCGQYRYDKNTSTFSRIVQTMLDLENEFCFAAKDFYAFENFTGGYHGGERIDIDTANCFVKFLADGEILTINSQTDSFTINCNSFRYVQKSSMHIVNDRTTSDVVSGHPIFGYHIKDNIFENCGFYLENTLDIVENISEPYSSIISTVYHCGLSCVAKGVGTSFIVPDGVFANSTGDNGYIYATNMKANKVLYWNSQNKISADIGCEFLQGMTEDDINEFLVWDRVNDSKYYRRVNSRKDLSNIGVVRSKFHLQYR